MKHIWGILGAWFGFLFVLFGSRWVAQTLHDRKRRILREIAARHKRS